MGRYGDPIHKTELQAAIKPLFFFSLLEYLPSPFKGLGSTRQYVTNAITISRLLYC